MVSGEGLPRAGKASEQKVISDLRCFGLDQLSRRQVGLHQEVIVFVAGASGAIGQPLITELVRQGHTVTGMTRSEAGAQKLIDMDATVAIVSAFDGAAVEEALRRSQAEVVIDQLTALPKDP